MDNQTDNKKNIHWFIIDDDIRVLKNMHAELKAGGIDDAHIHCLRPQRREAFREFKLRPKFWIQDESVVPDWEYIVEEWRYTIAVWGQGDKEFIRVNTQTLSSLLNEVTPEGIDTYFVFFIDIQYADHNEDGSEILCDYCGFDIFRSIRWMIKPELYIARFLSHLSRRLMQGLINDEYAELKLGRETSVTDKSKSVRLGERDFYNIDWGFFSKAAYRKKEEQNSGKEIKINILNQYIINCIQEALPKYVTNENIFWTYNNSYPTTSFTTEYVKDIKDLIIRYNSSIDKKKLFSNRAQFLNCYYNKIKNSKNIDDIGLFEEFPKEFDFPDGSDMANKIRNGLHFRFSTTEYKYKDDKQNYCFKKKIWLDLKETPLYREELQKWYGWYNYYKRVRSKPYIIRDKKYSKRLHINDKTQLMYDIQELQKLCERRDSDKNVRSILYIGGIIDPISLHINGVSPDEESRIINEDELDNIDKIVGELRPRYIIVNVPKLADKYIDAIQKIIELMQLIPHFAIHGFAVYFYDPENKFDFTELGNICKLTCSDESTEITISKPISPIYSKLIFLLYFQEQEDAMCHRLVHKLYDITPESWNTTKKWLGNMFHLKQLFTKNDTEFETLCEAIHSLEYLEYKEGKWIFNENEEEEMSDKDLITKLNLSPKSRKFYWILITERENINEKDGDLAKVLKDELTALQGSNVVSNQFIFNQETDFLKWNYEDVKTKKGLEVKLKDVASSNRNYGGYVFLFDSKVPVYEFEEGNKIKKTTAIQFIGKQMEVPLSFRILFTNKANKKTYFEERAYLDTSNFVETKGTIDKSMREAANGRLSFCYYQLPKNVSGEEGISSVSIFLPDVLYFIQKDLEAQPHKVLNSTLCTPELRKRFAEEHSQEIAKWYKDSTSIINDKVSKLKKLGKNPDFTKIAATLFCTFTGYRIPENESLNFFKDRLILLSYYVNRDLLENVEDEETDFSVNYLWAMWVLKKYSFSLCQKNPSEKEKNYKIKWNELFEHEKKINFDMIIRKFSNESLLEKIGELAVEIDKLFTEYASTKDKKIWKQSESANEVEEIMRKSIGQYFYIPENGFNAYDFLKDLDLLRNDQGQS